MIAKGNRRNGQPILVENSSAKHLDRVSLDGGSFNEAWIQKLIHEQPSILPINEIEKIFSPLISIGREISTPAGYIDNLFISPEGYITIVETKLWRNPEARREVIGQIIDYATELSKWSFSDLEATIKLANHSADSLLTIVQKAEELDETKQQDFIDTVNRNLKLGRFLLLIVGDGIRDNVESMVDYINKSPQLHFTLALIELQVFRFNHDNNSFVVIPQLVTRTKEIVRSTIRIEGVNLSDVKINVETDFKIETDISKVNSLQRPTITAEDFFEQLEKNTNRDTVNFAKQIIKDSEEQGYYIEWNKGSFGIKLPDPQGSGINIGIMTIDRGGLIYPAFMRGQLEKFGLPLEAVLILFKKFFKGHFNKGQLNNGFACQRRKLVILRIPPVVAQPTQSSFHNPSFG